MSFYHCSFKMWSSHNIYKKNYYCTVQVVEYGKALGQISPQTTWNPLTGETKNWGINIWVTQPILVIFTQNILYNRLRSWSQFLWSFKSFSNCLYQVCSKNILKMCTISLWLDCKHVWSWTLWTFLHLQNKIALEWWARFKSNILSTVSGYWHTVTVNRQVHWG